MKFLWGLDHDATAGEIRDHFSYKNWSKQSVSTFLKRLVRSGYLEMYKTQQTKFAYSVLISENNHDLMPVYDIINNKFKGSYGDFVCSLFDPNEELSQTDIQKIQDIINML